MKTTGNKNWAMLGLVGAALFLTGCAEHQLRKLHSMTPTGSAFSQALTKEYKDLATKEQRWNYDDIDSELFSLKGQDAAAGNGESVMPENPLDWEVPMTKMPEVEKAHKRLVSALKCNGRTKAPVKAAMAQRKFDEWVEEAEERFQLACMEGARLDFYENLRQVEEVICPLDAAPRFHLHFNLDSDKLDDRAMAIIQEAAASAGDNCHCKVFLTGRTDAVASHHYNMDLSKRRAMNAMVALEQAGLATDRIMARGFGEVPGSPQIHRPNRHVEIIIH
ncbi:MAG: OmpA family protein [Alphaproteobacteria bacterium]